MRALRGSSLEWTAGTEEVPLRELVSGNPIGPKGTWHTLKVANLAKRLSDLLRRDAVHQGADLANSQRQQGLEELNNLNDALDAPDNTGTPRRPLRRPGNGSNIRAILNL
jgi:hypothetical protein